MEIVLATNPVQGKELCLCRILMDAEYKKTFAILFTKVCMHVLIYDVQYSD